MRDLTSKRDEIVQLLDLLKRQEQTGAQVYFDVRVLPMVLAELLTRGKAV